MCNNGNFLMSLFMECHCSQSSGSSGSSYSRCFCQRVCIRSWHEWLLKQLILVDQTLSNESWRTSRLVIKCTVAKVVALGISDTLSVLVSQWMPRTLAGLVESAVFSLFVIIFSIYVEQETQTRVYFIEGFVLKFSKRLLRKLYLKVEIRRL